MSGLQSEVILSLPAVLSCEILSVWLSVPDLVRLDSAYCHHMSRQMFYALHLQLELTGSFCYNCRQNIFWFLKRRIRLREFSACVELPTDLVVGYLKDFGRTIESIVLTDDTNSEIIEAVRVHCPNARSLNIFEVVGLALGLLNTLQRVHSLEVLFTNYFGWNRLPTSDLNDLPNLRKLKITWENAKIKDILSLVAKCSRLTHFSAHCCDSVTSTRVISMFSNLPYLTALDVSALDIDDSVLAVISLKCPLLEHLDLHSCNTITDAGIYSVATNLKLKSISIPCYYELTDRSIEHLQHCRSTLQKLHISHWESDEDKPVNFSRSAVQSLLQSSQNACQFTWSTYLMQSKQKLNVFANTTALSVCFTLTDALLFDIAQHCPYLESFDIDSVTESTGLKITSAGLVALIDSCSVLKQIHVHRKMNRAPYADVMTLHSKLFVVEREPAYDVMEM